MDPNEFKNSPSGHLVPTIDGAMAFVPHPLPPPILDLARLTAPLADAMHALGELAGVGRTLQNPFLLIGPFMRVEAVASSKIEGTVTTLPELLMLEVDADDSKARNDTVEVRNYRRALEFGLKRIEEFPISVRLMCEMHVQLLEGVSPTRGARIQPGELKKEQNWIGARLIKNARYVPPPPAEAQDALTALENYIHDDSNELPLLIKLAIVHYQFEAIHPFPDGNGRIGRLLIPLILCARKVMPQPLLYLSDFLEQNNESYIDLMFEVSRSGRWDAWISFFLEGVKEASRNAIQMATSLQELHRSYLAKVQAARSSALLAKIVDSLFDSPAITIPHTMRNLGISYNAAKNNINKLVDLGILEPWQREQPQWFFAFSIMAIVYHSEGRPPSPPPPIPLGDEPLLL